MSYTEEMFDYFTNKGFYVLTENDFDRYLEVMTNSFLDYSLMRFITGGQKKEDIERFQRVSIKGMDDNCITIADSEEINGILAFYKPGTEPSPLSFIMNGGLSFFSKFGIIRTFKSLLHMIEMGKIMNKYKKPNDIYIYFLATDPKAQGKGIGKRLMKAVTELCEELGCGVYLETFEGKNISFYEKCGFKLMETVTVKVDFDLKLYSFYKSVD